MLFPTPAFEWPLDRCRRHAVAVLCGCIVLPACAFGGGPAALPANGAGDAAAAITHITLEHDCSGCATGARLELRRDGSAQATVTGKARRGTQDKVAQARLAPADFERLAQAVVAAGFFELADSYEEPGLQDGPWATLAVQRGAVLKQVFRRDEAGPAALKALEAQVLALQSRLVFVADRP